MSNDESTVDDVVKNSPLMKVIIINVGHRHKCFGAKEACSL